MIAVPVTKCPTIPTITLTTVPTAGIRPFGGSDDGGPVPVTTAIPSENTDLYLKVGSDYLAEQRVMSADIIIMSYSGGSWKELPMHLVYSSSNDVYFIADADTYSLLAIGNTKDEVSGLPSFSAR